MALLSTDRLDRRLDENGDMYIGPNGSEPISGIEGVAQLVVIALRLFKEEWFLNMNKGMPWFQEILGEKLDEQLVRKRISEIVLAVPSVVGILSLGLRFEAVTRSLFVSLMVRTVFGDTQPDAIQFAIGGSNG
jgi:hypothetical protein